MAGVTLFLDNGVPYQVPPSIGSLIGDRIESIGNIYRSDPNLVLWLELERYNDGDFTVFYQWLDRGEKPDHNQMHILGGRDYLNYRGVNIIERRAKNDGE